jgi:WD40 repeat protein
MTSGAEIGAYTQLVRECHIGPERHSAIALSSEGRWLLLGHADGSMRVVTTEGRTLWRVKEHSGRVGSVCWSSDGKRVGSGSDDGTSLIHEASNGRPLLRSAVRQPVRLLQWTSVHHLLLATDSDVVRIDERTGDRVSLFRRATPDVVCGALHAGSGLLALGLRDGRVEILNLASGQIESSIAGDGSAVSQLLWLVQRDQLVAALDNGNLLLLDTSSRLVGRRVQAARGRAPRIAASPDGVLLMAGDSAGRISFWDSELLGERGSLRAHNSVCEFIAFMPDGRQFVSSDGAGIRVWRLPHVSRPASPTHTVSTALTAYANRQAGTVGRHATAPVADSWVPQLPEGDGKRLLGVIRGPEPESEGFSGVAITPDSRGAILAHPDKHASAWDLTTGERLWRTAEKVGYDIQLSPDGKWAAASRLDEGFRILDAATGRQVATCGGQDGKSRGGTWAPDSRCLAGTDYDDSAHDIRIWDALTGQRLAVCSGHEEPIQGLDWSRCGRFLASGADDDDGVRIWDPETGACLRHFQPGPETVWGLKWSPDGQVLAVSYRDGDVLLLDAETVQTQRHLHQKGERRSGASGLAWSPDGRFVAVEFRRPGCSILIWDAATGEKVLEFTGPSEASATRLAWSPNGAFLASSHNQNTFRFWNVRGLGVVASALSASEDTELKPLTGDLRLLPLAMARLLRLGIHPPLSLLRDLLAACGGRAGGSCEPLRGGLRPLAELRWPTEARVGLAALLLHDIPRPGWSPPSGTTPSEVRAAVVNALAGSEIPPEAPSPPIALLRQACKKIDERLLSLLTLLGPEAVAAEPGLPLRLLPKVGAMPRLNRQQRQLLGVRVRVEGQSGTATGIAAGMDRAVAGGIEMGPLDARRRSLLPTQLAMPAEVQWVRHLRAELLFRSREAAEPPQLRPTVIVLDVSPPTFGPVESVTRLAAHLVASTLREAGVPVVLVTPDEPADAIVVIEHRADLVEAWTRRTLSPANAVRLLRAASAVRASLGTAGAADPAVLLLSHCWFGAEDRLPEVPGLRGLFVRHPGHDVSPAAASCCERHHRLAASETSSLGRVVGELLA